MPAKKSADAGEVARQKASLITGFRRRSIQLKIQGFSILGLIVVLLGAAIWIFFSAAEITKQDVAADKSFRRSADIEARMADVEKKIPPRPTLNPSDREINEYGQIISALSGKINEFIGLLDEKNKEVLDFASKGGGIDRGVFDLRRILKIRELTYFSDLKEDASLKGLDDSYRTDNLVVFGSFLSKDIKTIDILNMKFLEIEGIVSKAREFRSKVREDYSKKLIEWTKSTQKEINELNELREGFKLVSEQERKQKFGLAAVPQDEKNVSIPFLIQTNVTRFGPMLIILFFVNILVNLYRYSVRLSAYYDARADSLELIDIGIDPDSFQKYASSVSPDALDIAKPPKLPTEYAVDIAKAAVSKIGSGSKG